MVSHSIPSFCERAYLVINWSGPLDAGVLNESCSAIFLNDGAGRKGRRNGQCVPISGMARQLGNNPFQKARWPWFRSLSCSLGVEQFGQLWLLVRTVSLREGLSLYFSTFEPKETPSVPEKTLPALPVLLSVLEKRFWRLRFPVRFLGLSKKLSKEREHSSVCLGGGRLPKGLQLLCNEGTRSCLRSWGWSKSRCSNLGQGCLRAFCGEEIFH